MSTGLTWQTESTSLENTIELASAVGHNLRGGEIIELVSDLGGGKTAFVRGLALGLGSSDPVRSPSFTISNQYQAGDLTLYHFDFYRLDQAGIISQELAEILNDKQAVVVAEWADIVDGVLPSDILVIRIRATGETRRKIFFEYPQYLKYLIPSHLTR